MGDRLVLTKAIGTGIITTALKARRSDAETEGRVVRLMAELNKGASEAMVGVGVNACTDITGFGLLGHLRRDGGGERGGGPGLVSKTCRSFPGHGSWQRRASHPVGRSVTSLRLRAK